MNKTVPSGRKAYLRLASRARSNSDASWNALKKIAQLINEKKGPWA